MFNIKSFLPYCFLIIAVTMLTAENDKYTGNSSAEWGAAHFTLELDSVY